MAISGDNERVYVTLPKTVVNRLRELADEEMRTLSAMTAVMVLRGLKATDKGMEEIPKGD